MDRTAKFIKNTLATGLMQVVAMISGFIIPKIMLMFYGSEINGIVTSITQLISYLTLWKQDSPELQFFPCINL